eukprot:6187602-Pleurochrysis_carterae.AAC.6
MTQFTTTTYVLRAPVRFLSEVESGISKFELFKTAFNSQVCSYAVKGLGATLSRKRCPRNRVALRSRLIIHTHRGPTR